MNGDDEIEKGEGYPLWQRAVHNEYIAYRKDLKNKFLGIMSGHDKIEKDIRSGNRKYQCINEARSSFILQRCTASSMVAN